MCGIDLDRPIQYIVASLRFFDVKEKHVDRLCRHDVLLLVYEGVLRFFEDGVEQQIRAGQYYIQKAGSYQYADKASDAPKYLYVHFMGEWSEGEKVLSRSGNFDYASMAPLISRMDKLGHGNYSYTERSAVFFDILSMLYRSSEAGDGTVRQIRRFIQKNYTQLRSLEEICVEFHYSKNHVINLFKEEYGLTPFEYINDLRIKKAMYLLEVTPKSIEEISGECGFNHYSHFYRLFVRKNGTSPYEWRARIRTEAHVKQA